LAGNFCLLVRSDKGAGNWLGCREAAARFSGGLVWRKGHPVLLHGCLGPKSHKNGEATRQNSV